MEQLNISFITGFPEQKYLQEQFQSTEEIAWII